METLVCHRLLKQSAQPSLTNRATHLYNMQYFQIYHDSLPIVYTSMKVI